MAHAPQFLKLVQDAKKRVKETNVPDVKRRMDAGERFVLIDVREDNEWAKGHVPNAVHLGKGIIERDIEQRIPDTGAKLILYCGGGFRSALVADNLQKMGYHNVESMDGGWKGWVDAGLPTTTDWPVSFPLTSLPRGTRLLASAFVHVSTHDRHTKFLTWRIHRPELSCQRCSCSGIHYGIFREDRISRSIE